MSTGTRYPSSSLELWGGIECTINRIGDRYRDQLEYAGHYGRDDDIDRFAELGITRMRYPVLWERHETVDGGAIDWKWATRRLNALRERGITPIVGLLHHGSGPAFTDLLDEAFPYKLAKYAGRVARQFPWIKYYTPVNEPLTTARFSGRYGHWYPHHTNELSFIRMLLNQVKGIILSMREIQRVNPAAQLVQTEDLAKTHSTTRLAYQADFENQRRWLTYDLLCGRFNRQHFFWKYFMDHGIEETELAFFAENSCIPSIAGFNYYVTSERYLDHRLGNYPESMHGGNGRDRYVDTEAFRANKAAGLTALLLEAWERYGVPMAVTECHLSCTREEQLRWIKDTWNDCRAAQREGANIIALTAWAMLGAYDWNSLLTQENHHYESGIFDMRNGHPRMTALGRLVRCLASGTDYHHPVLDNPGWWHCPSESEKLEGRPLLLYGDDDGLMRMVRQHCEVRRINHQYIRPDCGSAKILHTAMHEDPWCIIAIEPSMETSMDLIEDGGLDLLQTGEDPPRVMLISPNGESGKNSDGVMGTNGLSTCLLDPPNDTGDSPLKDYETAVQYSRVINQLLDLLLDEETGHWFQCGDELRRRESPGKSAAARAAALATVGM